MSDARHLRKELEASLQPQLARANPLRTLGFSTELLKLGLSEDELYDHVYATARILMKRMHPDREGNDEIQGQQRNVSEAFGLLKNRPLFGNWVRDFREGLDAGRSEVNILKQAADELRRSSEAYRGIAAKATSEARSLRQEHEVATEAFQRYLLMRRLVLRGGSVFSSEQTLAIQVMSFRLYEDRNKRRVTICRRHGEELFPLKGIRRRDVEGVPGAPSSPALAIGFEALRRLLAGQTSHPVVGIAFQELTTKFGHYTETIHHPGDERVILGSMSPAELNDRRTRTTIWLPYRALPSILGNEIYPGVVLVSDNVLKWFSRGTGTESQLKILRGRLARIPRDKDHARASDIVVAVRSSDPP
ncbi:MAG TPA: hypothetical protein VJ837_02345 [Candidatus Paceibacterota bacterium]|nr:hypothetical protein [Candidatus Paceibacterota bacterium]